MLIGLSHIALNCVNIREAGARLASYGYTNIFGEKQLPNHKAKRTMMAKYVDSHDIQFYTCKGSMSIELISYGNMCGLQSSDMIPLIRTSDSCEEWDEVPIEDVPISESGMNLLADLYGVVPVLIYDPALSMKFFWIKNDKEPSGLAACILPTKSLERTKDVLSALRFGEIRPGFWSILTPITSLQAKLIPVQYRDTDMWSSESVLDAPGSPCLALMAANTSRMQIPRQCKEQYARFDLIVNHRNCHITMAKPKNFPYVEFIQFANDY